MRSLLAPHRWFVALALVTSVALVRTAFAEDGAAKDAKESDSKEKDDGKKEKEGEKKDGEKEAPAQVTAAKGSFSVVLTLDGILDAKDSTPIEVHTDVYGGELEAKSAPILVPTLVEAGDVLVTFDSEKIDDQIAGAGRDLDLGKLGLERAKEEAKRDEAEGQRALARAKVERDRAVESLEYFNKVERTKRVTESEMSLKSSNDSVTDQLEELEQLKKMYKADDVVEETEKIVMARSERQLERSKKYLEIRKEEHDRLLKLELPRELEDREHAAARATAEYEKSVVTTPMGVEKTRREIVKSEFDLELQSKNLGKLLKDRALFDVKAPFQGLAVPGSLTEGTWRGGDDIVKALRTKEGLKPHQVLFTLLPGSPYVVRVALPEASILDVTPGQTAEVRLAAAPTRVLKAKVATIGRTASDGKFDVVLDVADTDARWMPGFAAKVKLTTVTKTDAITVPEDCVVTKGETHRVFVWVDGKAVAKDVEVGATSGERTEILKGLEAGTKVLQSPPK